MRVLIASVTTLVLAVVNFGMLFGWGMSGGFDIVRHTPDLSDYLEVLAAFVIQVIIINAIVVSWVIALRKYTNGIFIRIFLISIPAALVLLRFAQG